RKVTLDASVSPATIWNPAFVGGFTGPSRDLFVRSVDDRAPLPANDADIAFASVTRLSRWIERRAISSERLTNIYLARLEKFDPELRCLITLTTDAALAQARQADAKIADHCTAFRMASKTCSTRPVSRRRTVPNHSGHASLQRTRSSSAG